MKKSILTLVLASLALPTIAGSLTEILSADKLNKVNNAISTLEGYGINHTVVADNISDKLNLSYTWDNGNNSWTQTLTEALENGGGVQGALIINGGSNQLWHAGTNYASSNGINYNTASLTAFDSAASQQFISMSIVKAKIAPYNTSDFSYTQIGSVKYFHNASAESIETETEAYYDQLFSNADSNNVHQESDGLVESLSGDIGGLIVDNAKGLKETIKTIGYQVAAAEVGKGLSANCIGPEGEIYSIGVCATLGSNFL